MDSTTNINILEEIPLRELDKLSIDNIRNYADMVGAEYQLITGKPFRKHLTAQICI